MYRWRKITQRPIFGQWTELRSHEPYAIARLSESFIVRFTIDVDAPEEGSDVTLTEARYIDMAKCGLVKGYSCKVITVNQARDFREVCQGVQLVRCKVVIEICKHRWRIYQWMNRRSTYVTVLMWPLASRKTSGRVTGLTMTGYFERILRAAWWGLPRSNQWVSRSMSSAPRTAMRVMRAAMKITVKMEPAAARRVAAIWDACDDRGRRPPFSRGVVSSLCAIFCVSNYALASNGSARQVQEAGWFVGMTGRVHW